MKFTASADDMVVALTTVVHGIPTRPQGDSHLVKILADNQKGEIAFTCGDGDILITRTCTANVQDPGTLLVDPRKLLAAIGRGSNEIAVEDRKNRLTVKGYGKSTIGTQDADLFPQHDTSSTKSRVHITQKQYKSLMVSVAPGELGETKHSGIHVITVEGNVYAFSSDKVRGTIVDLGPGEAAAVFATGYVTKAFRVIDHESSFGLTRDNRARIEMDRITISMSMREVQPLDFRSFMGDEPVTTLFFEQREVVQVLEAIVLFSGEGSPCKVEFLGDAKVIISSMRGKDDFVSPELNVGVVGKDDPFESLFCAKYLLDAIKDLGNGCGLQLYSIKSEEGQPVFGVFRAKMYKNNTWHIILPMTIEKRRTVDDES